MSKVIKLFIAGILFLVFAGLSAVYIVFLNKESESFTYMDYFVHSAGVIIVIMLAIFSFGYIIYTLTDSD